MPRGRREQSGVGHGGLALSTNSIVLNRRSRSGEAETLVIAGQPVIEFLRRRMSCDWSELIDDDGQEY